MQNLAAQFSKAVERWLVSNGDLFGQEVDDQAKEAAAQDDLQALAEKAKADTSVDPDAPPLPVVETAAN